MGDFIVFLGAVLNLHLQQGYPTMQDFPLSMVSLSTYCMISHQSFQVVHMCAYSNDIA